VSKKEQQDIRNLLRNVFLANAQGKRALAHILSLARFFNTIGPDDESRALQNFAKVLLSEMGILHEDNILNFVNAISDLPVKGT